MSERTKIEIEFGDDLGTITSNVELTKAQRKALIDVTLEAIKKAVDEKDDGSEDVENIDEEDAVSAVNMYRAALVHALQLFPNADDDYVSLVQTFAKTIEMVDPKFLKFFKQEFGETLED